MTTYVVKSGSNESDWYL